MQKSMANMRILLSASITKGRKVRGTDTNFGNNLLQNRWNPGGTDIGAIRACLCIWRSRHMGGWIVHIRWCPYIPVQSTRRNRSGRRMYSCPSRSRTPRSDRTAMIRTHLRLRVLQRSVRYYYYNTCIIFNIIILSICYTKANVKNNIFTRNTIW